MKKNSPAPKRCIEKKKSKSTPKLVGGIVAGVVVVLAVVTCASCAKAAHNDTLVRGTQICGVSVGDLTKEEAVARLEQTVSPNTVDAVLPLEVESEEPLYISVNEAQAGPDFQAAVDEAYERGHRGWLKSGMDRMFHGSHSYDAEFRIGNQGYLDSAMDTADSLLAQSMVDHSFTPDGKGNLVMTRGISGRALDRDATMELIVEALENNNYEPVQAVVITATPEDPDFEAVAESVYVAPQDARFDSASGEFYADVTGVSLDAEGAKAAFEPLAEGESTSYPLIMTKPSVTTADLSADLFKDLLGSCTCTASGSSNRLSNIRLAAATVNGTILNPGEEFSYNGVVGSRTTAAGYLPAPAYGAGGKTVQEVGGGICQVSSSIYYAALKSNLKITERHPHMYAVGYLPDGTDATVFYGSVDFKFVNDTKYPIRINAALNGSTLNVNIYGTKTNNNYVQIETKQTAYDPATTVYKADSSVALGNAVVDTTAYNGRTVEAYRCVYSGDGSLISRTLESNNKYLRRDKVVLVNPADSRVGGSGSAPASVPASTPASTPAPVQQPAPTPAPEPVTTPETPPVTTPETPPVTVPETPPETPPASTPEPAPEPTPPPVDSGGGGSAEPAPEPAGE